MTSENLTSDADWHEFDCTDCGILVFSSIPVPDKCCAGCKWLRGIADPVDRARLRGQLARLGSIGGGIAP